MFVLPAARSGLEDGGTLSLKRLVYKPVYLVIEHNYSLEPLSYDLANKNFNNIRVNFEL